MSLQQKLAHLLLYRPPKSSACVFHSGLEDRLQASLQKQGNKQTGSKRKKRRPRKIAQTAIEKKFKQELAADQAIDKLLDNKTKLSPDLEENRRILATIFRMPQNKDAVLRNLSIGTDPPVKALLVFFDGITHSLLQNLAVLQPLMLLPSLQDRTGKQEGTDKDFFQRVKEALLPNNQIATIINFDEVVEEVLSGNSVLFIDGFDRALSLETRSWPTRGISNPQVEAVIRGPQEAFNEQIRNNTALIRRIIHQPSLVTEFIKVGKAATLQCAIMYLDDVANPDLVQEVKRRLESIQANYTQETGMLEQMIEDAPHYPAPQALVTERPDRVAAGLIEGRIAIILDGNPFVIVVPATFFTLMQSPEDAYIRWPLGTFARVLRYMGLFLALLLPAIYIAVVAFHQELIPTDLLLAMTGAREKVPFPSIVEVLLMEFSFELIREAGIRIPGTVGTTLGIVGALILGQAAVAANIVSPILIIVVAVTAIGSFAIPDYSFALSIRVLRFIYILLASIIGLLGILTGIFIHIALLTNLQSFGVPFLAPAAPITRKGHDFFARGAAWQQKTRPDYLDPLKIRRQPDNSRQWLRPNNKTR